MSFISYAQNFEDVMLWRALKHIDRGFYVDIGANDPDVDSVTKAFYEHGWRGINVEPVTQWYEKLERERVRDINLNIAAGAEEGEVSFYEIPDTGLSTSVKDISLDHESRHGFVGVERKVPVRRLTNICTELHVSPIHFLKIDVEGAEKSVLLGLDLSSIKPWIVVVESTLPLSQEENFVEWESVILMAGYSFVYFDGLNRFYLSPEHDELRQSFSCPPNVFDGFSFSGLASNSFCAIQNEKIVSAEALARAEAQRAEQAEAHAQAEAQRAEQAEAHAQAEAQRAQQAEAHALAEAQRAQHAEAQAQEMSTRAEEAAVRAQQSEAQVEQAEFKVHEANARAEWLQNEWNLAKAKIDELNRISHHWWTIADGLSRDRQVLYASRSWRITWPLRQFGLFARWGLSLPRRLACKFKQWLKIILRPILLMGMRAVLKRPLLKQRVNAWLHRHPTLRGRLMAIVRKAGFMPGMASPSGPVMQTTHSELATQMQSQNPDLSHLSENARRIYFKLNTAVQQHNREVR